jgi:DNA-binding response OmpR family regulator
VSETDVLRQDKQGQPSVLVAESDPSLRHIFQIIFKRIGLRRRVVVGTAKEAIKSLRTQKFDLMFLDFQLPDGPGALRGPLSGG